MKKLILLLVLVFIPSIVYAHDTIWVNAGHPNARNQVGWGTHPDTPFISPTYAIYSSIADSSGWTMMLGGYVVPDDSNAFYKDQIYNISNDTPFHHIIGYCDTAGNFPRLQDSAFVTFAGKSENCTGVASIENVIFYVSKYYNIRLYYFDTVYVRNCIFTCDTTYVQMLEDRYYNFGVYYSAISHYMPTSNESYNNRIDIDIEDCKFNSVSRIIALDNTYWDYGYVNYNFLRCIANNSKLDTSSVVSHRWPYDSGNPEYSDSFAHRININIDSSVFKVRSLFEANRWKNDKPKDPVAHCTVSIRGSIIYDTIANNLSTIGNPSFPFDTPVYVYSNGYLHVKTDDLSGTYTVPYDTYVTYVYDNVYNVDPLFLVADTHNHWWMTNIKDSSPAYSLGILPAQDYPENVQKIVFNEIAWMGTVGSAADEWIELYNPNPYPQDVTGWSIYDIHGDLQIILDGTIGAYSYYLIERTDDNTILDIAADLVTTFGGGLLNTGEELYLITGSGYPIETLYCVSGWYASDNTAPKYSMERVNPNTPSIASNWKNNNGVIRNGLDVSSNQINGTPRALNSVSYGTRSRRIGVTSFSERFRRILWRMR